MEYSVEEPDIISFKTREYTSTLEACIETENATAQRKLYFEAIWQAVYFTIDENTLTFYDSERNEVLVCNRRQVHLMDPADLVGTDWQLETLNDTPVPEGLEISLSFTSGNEASGRAGNYTYRLLDYEAKGDIIRWGIQAGRDGESAGDQQHFALAYLDAIIAGTHQYNQTEDTLELFTQKGETLVYRLMEDRE